MDLDTEVTSLNARLFFDMMFNFTLGEITTII